MKQRLERYRRMTAPAAVNKPSFVSETVLEPVSSQTQSGNAARGTLQSNAVRSTSQSNATAATSQNTHASPPPVKTVQPESGLKLPGLPQSLFGIELTRDNCLIIALIIMLAKEKADIKLIIALIYLLL